MFQLSQEEFENLKSQFAASSWGGRRKLPYAFTEQCVAMLSGVLHSDRAIKVNIQIMRVFTRMRKLLEAHKEILKKLYHLERREIEQDEKIMLIFEYLKQLEQVRQQDIDQRNRKRVGFKRMDEH
jgi:chromosome condensin MukBEF ATPase and DNA-binding subunit MukB